MKKIKNENNVVVKDIDAKVLECAKMPELRTLGKMYGLKVSGKGITADVLKEQLKAFIVTEENINIAKEVEVETEVKALCWVAKEFVDTSEDETRFSYTRYFQVEQPVVNILDKQECLDICKKIFCKSATTGTPRIMYELRNSIPDLNGKYAVTHRALYYAVSGVMIAHAEYRDVRFVNDCIQELCQKNLLHEVTRTGGGKFYLVNDKLMKKFLDANKEQPKQEEQVIITEQPSIATEEDIPVVDESLFQ